MARLAALALIACRCLNSRFAGQNEGWKDTVYSDVL